MNPLLVLQGQSRREKKSPLSDKNPTFSLITRGTRRQRSQSKLVPSTRTNDMTARLVMKPILITSESAERENLFKKLPRNVRKLEKSASLPVFTLMRQV